MNGIVLAVTAAVLLVIFLIYLICRKRKARFSAAGAKGQPATCETYTPVPMDTSDVELPEELQELAESIAANVHEVWSAGRISDGWSYGPVRDDQNKKHPCLVPYDELPESEKEYDRHTSQETVKMILKSGFYIRKKPGE